MSKGRGLALLKAIKERQLQEESQPTRSEIGENEKSRTKYFQIENIYTFLPPV